MDQISKLFESIEKQYKSKQRGESDKTFVKTYALLNEASENKVVAVGVILLFLVIFYFYASQIICIVIGTFYPIYQSIIALDCEAADKVKWLKYWVIYALICFMDPIIKLFVGSFSVYWYFKSALFIWLMLPVNICNGLELLYHLFALPFYNEVNKVNDKLGNLLDPTPRHNDE